jgi:hypothetical protein
MRRVIRIDYRFKYAGRVYEGRGVSVGETIEDTTPENENRLSAACHALGVECDDAIFGNGAWGWYDDDWKRAGFEFEYCEESQ